MPALDTALGIYLPLIVVNCIILGRAEMFASKNSVGRFGAGRPGHGPGLYGTLVVMGCVRELLGAARCSTCPYWSCRRGAASSLYVPAHDGVHHPSRRLLRVRLLMALVIWRETKTDTRTARRSIGCEGCPSAPPAYAAANARDKAEGGEA